jgi:hypothetical protein
MNIYVDIDETICYYEGERDYEKALPIKKNIEKINSLYDAGHQITYWTARGTVTGKYWMLLIVKQFEDWGVKYTNIKIGKPAYDLFIDDKALNGVSDWGKIDEYIENYGKK